MIISNEQFSAAYDKLPFPIREFLAGNDLVQITEQIGQQYGLHIDTVGALDREITNMLLGFLSPAEFVGELKSIGVPEQIVGAIVKDLNAKVFMPLRERMQHATEEPDADENASEGEMTQTNQIPPVAQISQPVASISSYDVPSAATFVPPSSTFVPSAAPAYVPPAPVTPAPAYMDSNPLAAIPSAAMPSSAYVQPPVPAPRPSVSEFARPIPPLVPPRPLEAMMPTPAQAAPQASYVPPTPSSVAVPISISSTEPQLKPAPYSSVLPNIHVPARTMAQDMQAAQASPAPAAAPRINPPQPAYSAPMPTPQTPAQAARSTWTTSAATPPVEPVQNTPTATSPTPQAPLSPQQTANRDALHSVLKEYGVDPYREPPV